MKTIKIVPTILCSIGQTGKQHGSFPHCSCSVVVRNAVLLLLWMPLRIFETRSIMNASSQWKLLFDEILYGRKSDLASKFLDGFDPNRKMESLPGWYHSPTYRPLTRKTLHTTDFNCRFVARHQQQRGISRSDLQSIGPILFISVFGIETGTLAHRMPLEGFEMYYM